MSALVSQDQCAATSALFFSRVKGDNMTVDDRIFLSHPDPMWIYDLETLRFLEVNEAAVGKYGYSRDEFLAMTIADIRPAADRDALLKSVAAVTGANTSGPWRHCLKSGEVIYVDISGNTIDHLGRRAELVAARDVSRLVKAEQAAHQALSREQSARAASDALAFQFQRMFDSVPGLFVVYEPEGQNVIAVSEAYLAAVGLTRAHVVGHSLFNALPPPLDAAFRAKLMASCQRVLVQGIADDLDVHEFVLPSDTAGEGGLRRLWAMSNMPVTAPDGRLLHLMLKFQDLTEALGEAADGRSAAKGLQVDLAAVTATLKTDNMRLTELATRMRSAQRLLNIGTWDFIYAENRLIWSDTVYDMYGVADRTTPISFDDYVSFVHPDDRDSMQAHFAAFAASDSKDFAFAHQILHPDGRIVHVHGVGEKVETAAGAVLTGVVQNVTEHIEAARALARTKRLLEIAGTSAKFGAWRYDVLANHIEWSPQTALIHDEPEGFSAGVSDGIAYYAPEYRDQISALFQDCLTHGVPFSGTFEIITAKLRRIWVRSTGEAERDETGRIIAVQGSFQDITELMNIRQKAAESEKLLELAGRAVKLGGWRVNLLDQTVFWTDGIAAIHEEPPGTVPTFEGGIDYFAPEDRDDARAAFQACALQGIPFDNVREVITAKGNRIKVRSLGEPVRDASGRIIAVEGAMQDISELTAARQQADALSMRLAQTLESIGDAFLMIDRDWRYTYVNGPAATLLRTTKENMLGRTIFEAFPDLAGSVFEAQFRTAMQTGTTVRFQHAFAPLEATFRIHAHPTPDGLAIYFSDVSEELRRDEQLRLSEARFRLITLATGTALWEWDILGNKDWWSDGLTEVFGHTPDPEGVTPSVWRSSIHADDLARVDAAIERLLSGETELLHERYRFRRADGTWAHVEDRAIAIRDGAGPAIRVLGSMTDISVELKLEERLRQSQKLEAIGQLTGGVAHDFNNLLTVIIGNMEMLQSDLEEGHPLRPFVSMSIKAADRAADLTSRLLAFSRKQALLPAVLDINQAILGIENMLRRTLGENIFIKVLPQRGLWRTEVDEGQLEAAILNLAINSRDAMPEGGALTIETANVSLDHAYVATEPDVQAGDYVVITISDSGHGIARDQIDRVFEPFFTTKAVGKGTGLGLSMVYGFVKQTGGHIRVYSEPGEGTTFRLYFPRFSGDIPTKPSRPDSVQPAIGQETILVVEDDMLILDQLSSQLTGLGYKVLTASEGEPALAILRARADVDLLFTDVMLPGGMNGRQVADEAQRIRPGLKVLYTSGYSENAIIHHGRLDQGVELLSKPYRRAELAVKIRKVLDS